MTKSKNRAEMLLKYVCQCLQNYCYKCSQFFSFSSFGEEGSMRGLLWGGGGGGGGNFTGIIIYSCGTYYLYAGLKVGPLREFSGRVGGFSKTLKMLFCTRLRIFQT